MDSNDSAKKQWRIGWNRENDADYYEAIKHYEIASDLGSSLAEERLVFLNGLGDDLWKSPEQISANWFDYTSCKGNIVYAKKYSKKYHYRDGIAFDYLFHKYFRDENPINIAIIGGGNGWELDEIYDILEFDSFFNNKPKKVVKCTVVDPVLWEFGHVGVHQSAGRGVEFIQKKFGQGERDIDSEFLEGYDLVYFARCINYADSRDMDLEWLKDTALRLSKNSHVVFHQVELSEERINTHEYEEKFKGVFGKTIRKCCPDRDLHYESLFEVVG